VLKFLNTNTCKCWLRKIVSRSPKLHSVYSAYSFKKQHTFLHEKAHESGVSQSLVSRKQVVEEVRRRKEKKNTSVCHIIGSGWSLNQSAEKINPQDFTIGFNYAAIADLDFDAYFFEFGGQKVKEISDNHIVLAREKVNSKTDLVYFKNIWEGKNDIDFISSNWLDLARPVMDHLHVALDKRHLSHVLECCLSDRSEYIPQLCSTVVTAVVLAYQAGFKEIVIHGLDFGGQYFYECMESDVDPKFLPPLNPVSGFYRKTSKTDVHPTALADVGMRDIVPVLHGLLQRKGIELMCGYENSPSSEYLPVYRNNQRACK
jgi:hypothetical protein